MIVGDVYKMKNHMMVGDKLLQTNKKFSHLKNTQKEKINQWLYDEYERLWQENGKIPGKPQKVIIINNVYSKIEEAEIWLPLAELYSYYESHINKFRKRYEKNHIEIIVEVR